jgi:hypothetical protein
VLPFQLVLRKTEERSSAKKESQRIGDEIKAAFVFARAYFLNVLCASHLVHVRARATLAK